MEASRQELICFARSLRCVYLQGIQGLGHLLVGFEEGLHPIAS